MAYVITMFESFDDAEKAVNMLAERKYPAEAITVIARNARGSHLEMNGGDIADGGADVAIAQFGWRQGESAIANFLRRFRKEDISEELVEDLAEAGIPSDRIEGVAERIRQGEVLVSVETEDIRAEDVRSILDNAAGRDLERYATRPEPDTGADVETQANAGGDV